MGSKKELSTERALQVIENLNNLGCREIYITGGEPLIRKDIFKILKKAKQKKFKIGLLTNGTLINKKNIKQIKFFVDEIGISLDGSSSQINDKIRGAGIFKKIIKAISIIKKHRIPLALYITLTKQNLSNLRNILKLATSLRVNFIRINEVSLRGRAYKNRRFLKIDDQIKKDFDKSLVEVLEKNFSQLRTVFLNENCSVNPETIFLSPSGYIYPCIEIFQRNPSCHLGNILRINPKRFQRYKRILSEFAKNKCSYEEIRGNNFSICLNSLFIKNCPVENKICQLKKSNR